MRRKPDSAMPSGFSATGYRMKYRDDLYRLLFCYVTITAPSISGCSEQRYENVPRDVKV